MNALEQFEVDLHAHDYLLFHHGPDVNWRAMPPMVAIYRDLAPGDRPPTQWQFVQRVMFEAERRDPGALPQLGVRGRAESVFPSLVRQHHFQVALAVSGLFDDCYWLPWLDMHGIDLLVTRDSLAVAIALSVDSDKASFWKRIKDRRHPPPRGLELLQLNADREEFTIGDFFLHPPRHVQMVAERMDDLEFDYHTDCIPTPEQARAVFEEAREHGSIRDRAGWLSDGRPLYQALCHDMRLRARGVEQHPCLDIAL